MFVKIENGVVAKYPYTMDQIKADNPLTSFPSNPYQIDLEAFGVFRVEYEATPDYDPVTHRVEVSQTPVLLNGKWTLTKTLIAKTQEELDDQDSNNAYYVRSKRESLLASSDWTQLPDSPVEKAAWATYRQSLRDITSQATFPTEVTWPTKPE